MQKIFNVLLESIGWLQIMLSPTLLGAVFGVVIYFNFPNTLGLVLGGSISFIGFLVGIIWATKKFKTQGTINFLSRISTSPDRKDNEEIKKS